MRNADTQDHQKTHVNKEKISSPKGENIEMSFRGAYSQKDV